MFRPPHERTVRYAIILALAVGVIAVGADVAAAEVTRTGGTVVVEEGETVDDDLTASAGTVVVRGTVRGDLDAFAGNVIVAETATITGDVTGFAGTVQIDGQVGGSVEALAGSVIVGPEAVVRGGVEAAAGTVELAGTVEGDVDASGGTVVLRESATVGGDLRYDAETFVDRGGTVRGSVVETDALAVGPSAIVPNVPGWAPAVYGFAANLLLGIVLLLFFPGASAAVAARAVERPLYATGVGIVALIAVPVALVALAITIVGIPLALVGALLFAVLVWVASVYGRFAVGSWMVALAGVDNRWAALLVGLLAVGLVARVPFLGGLVQFLVFLLGLGAFAVVSMTAYRTRETDGR